MRLWPSWYSQFWRIGTWLEGEGAITKKQYPVVIPLLPTLPEAEKHHRFDNPKFEDRIERTEDGTCRQVEEHQGVEGQKRWQVVDDSGVEVSVRTTKSTR